jgi:hypothetical protein
VRLRQERGRLLQKIRGLEQHKEHRKQEVRRLKRPRPGWGQFRERYPLPLPSPLLPSSPLILLLQPLFLQHARLSPAPGPLHRPFPLLKVLFSQMSPHLPSSHPLLKRTPVKDTSTPLFI